MVKQIKQEFRRQLKIGLSAAIGFIIAYAWREPIMLFFEKYVTETFNIFYPIGVGVVSALLITFCGVILIWIFSKVLK